MYGFNFFGSYIVCRDTTLIRKLKAVQQLKVTVYHTDLLYFQINAHPLPLESRYRPRRINQMLNRVLFKEILLIEFLN